MAVKIIATMLIMSAVSLQMSSGSAIPIWEFLTRNEKMSYLYSTFARLVSDHCKTNPTSRTVPVNHCKRDLLNYGYEQLQTSPDLLLDKLDPYQRGANELIWATIMRGHPSVTPPPNRRPYPTQQPTSMVVLTHQPSNNKSSYPKNPIFDEPEHKHTYAMDMDIAYGYAPPASSSAEFQSPSSPKQPPTYLSGPFVIRVRPDGTPIDGDKNTPYPTDDDLEAFQAATQHKFTTNSSRKQKRLAAQHLLMHNTPTITRTRRQSVSRPYSLASSPYYARRLVHV